MRVSLLGLVLLAAAPSEAAGLRTAFFAGGTQGTWTLTADGRESVSLQPKFALAYGALFELDLIAPVSLEIGGVFARRKMVGIGFEDEVKFFQIPAQLRYWPNEYLVIGFGAYFGFGEGQVTRDGVPGSFEEADYKSTDIGLIGSIGVNVPIGASLSLLVEGRYLLGLTEALTDNYKTVYGALFLYSANNTSRWNEQQLLVGLRYTMGGESSSYSSY